MLVKTHAGLHLHRWNCDAQVSHAHQIVGGAGEGKDPVHFADSAMSNLAQECNRLQPAKAFFDPLSFSLTDGYPACRVVRPSIALPPGRAWFCATWGVTCRCRHSFTKSRVSNPLSPPTLTGCLLGSFSSMISAASRSAVPLAWNTSASTISPLRFSTSRFPL